MVKVAAAVVFDGNGNVLLCSRPEDKPPAGWEFPGGKVESGETVFQALERELVEELSLRGRCGKELITVTADPVELHFIEFFPDADSVIIPEENQTFRWQRIDDEMPDDLLPNDRPVWKLLKNLKNN
ncbi:MAG: NUDIX domain-containing protein [Lentisphaeria bacterium]|nr:NUDIX domain-containing protein [Lentisphaeria bacterium]